MEREALTILEDHFSKVSAQNHERRLASLIYVIYHNIFANEEKSSILREKERKIERWDSQLERI